MYMIYTYVYIYIYIYRHIYIYVLFIYLYLFSTSCSHIVSLKVEKLIKVTDGVEHKAAGINSANANTVQIHCKT